MITIAVGEPVFEKASKYLRDWETFTYLLGDCVRLMPDVFSRSDFNNAAVFLGGHYSGCETGIADMEDWGFEEMDSIGLAKHNMCCVVIGDFRTFTGQRRMPSRSQLFKKAEESLPVYSVSVYLDQVFTRGACVITGMG